MNAKRPPVVTGDPLEPVQAHRHSTDPASGALVPVLVALLAARPGSTCLECSGAPLVAGLFCPSHVAPVLAVAR